MVGSVDTALLVAQAALHFFSAFLGFFICIPASLTKSDFGNICLLYARVDCTSGICFVLYPSRMSNCDYVIVIPVLFCILYGTGAGAVYVLQLIRQIRGQEPWLGLVVPLVAASINMVSALLVLVTACMLSAGLNSLCSDLTSGNLNLHCVQFQDFIWEDGINGSSFHTNLKMAEVCCWLCWLVIVAVTVISVFNLLQTGLLQQICPFLPGGSTGSSTARTSTRPGPTEMYPPATNYETDMRY